MILRSPTEDENEGTSEDLRRPSAVSVMPAWIAGIQARRTRPETSMSTWIPALHAGMTQSSGAA